MSSMMELKYFDARGAAEVIRLLFAMANEPYTDTRYTIEPDTMNTPEFDTAKESGELIMNLNRAPVLVVTTDNDGVVTIGQSKAIERFLAKKFGYMGQNDIEAAQIDCIAEHCLDVKLAQMRKGFSMYKNKDKTPEEREILRNEWFHTDMPSMLMKINKSVEQTSQCKGYAVGNQTSYADIIIFALLKDVMIQAEQPLVEKAAATDCELLLSIANRIAQNVNIIKWIETRPITDF